MSNAYISAPAQLGHPGKRRLRTETGEASGCQECYDGGDWKPRVIRLEENQERQGQDEPGCVVLQNSGSQVRHA